jgi:chitinase
MKLLETLLLVIFVAIQYVAAQKKVVCHYSAESSFKLGNAKFLVENIDLSLCTDIVYKYLSLQRNQLTFSDHSPKELQNIKKFTNLKYAEPYPNVLGSVGGRSLSSIDFSDVAKTKESRELFASSAARFLYYTDFDGLELDWEFPTLNGGTPEDKANFISLLQVLNEQLKVYRLTLFVSVSAIQLIAGKAYDIPKIHPHVDFINLKSFSYKGPWSKQTGYNAPLFTNDEFSVEASVNYWLKRGTPAKKLLMGIPLFGVTFTLTDQDTNGVGVASTGAGKPGQYTDRAGFLGYNEICSKKWQIERNDTAVALYGYRGDQWVSYDDASTIADKTEFINERGLGGVVVWSLENDDFKGTCGQGNFPLLKAVNNGLN